MTQVLTFLKDLAFFKFIEGYRTLAIAAFVVLGFVVELFGWYDVPGVTFGIEDVLVALGLVTAANHTKVL
jgi:hypothetical protein